MIEISPDLEGMVNALPAESRRLLERFNRMLVADAAVRGYIPRSPARQSWQSHILDSLAAVPLLEALLGEVAEPRIADVGSGAGLPGIPLAIARRQWQLTLLEERASRARLLDRFVRELQIENAEPEKGNIPRSGELFDATVARALAPPPRALELCRGLVRADGLVVLYLTGDQVAGWSAAEQPQPLGIARYRLPGLRLGRVAVAYHSGPAPNPACGHKSA
jgi:16S rRNA (guanine527-N7)-methyltransferase